jgi:hypothetical protein
MVGDKGDEMNRKSIPSEAEPPALDAQVEDHGSVLLVRPLADAACAWLKESTDGTWFGNALVVEPRYVCNLVARMRETGFAVEAG